MNIEKQFNLIAEEYDINRRRFIPCYDEFYEKTTDFIFSCINVPKRIADLGAGTGLLTYFWYQQCKSAEYVLVDIAEDMPAVAKRRFKGVPNVTFKTQNYISAFPDGSFDAVISALSIHHLTDKEKVSLFEKIYDRLPKGGVFVNYDQFCADSKNLNEYLNKYWENKLLNSGLTDNDIQLWKERRKADKECSCECETEMLKKCGFSEVKCIYTNQKFSVIMAIK